jgi:hypothetical protein
MDGQVTDAQIVEAHSQVEGFRDRLQRAVVRREAGVLPSAAVASPQPPPASESGSSQDDTCSESSGVLMEPEDSLSDGEYRYL